MKNQKVAIAIILLNLIVLIVVSILRSNTVAKYNFINYIYIFLIVVTTLIMFSITYSLIIKRFKRTENVVNQKDYAKLYDLENSQITGEELQFYFTIERNAKIKFSILNNELASFVVLKDEEVQPGGHIIRFDPKDLAKGAYYYCLETDNQQTMKKFWIQ